VKKGKSVGQTEMPELCRKQGIGETNPSLILASRPPGMLATWSFSLACPVDITRQQGFSVIRPACKTRSIRYHKLTDHVVSPHSRIGLTKDAPQLCVIVNVARIKVIPDSAFEEGRILGNDSQSTPQIQQSYG
jgi:hypothetical protein